MVTLRQDSQSQIERTLLGQKALVTYGGDGFTNPTPVTQNSGTQGASDRGADRLEDYDPSPRTPAGGSGSSSVSLSETKLDDNKVPENKNWNINEWLEEDGDQCHDFEESGESDSLPVPVNFEYIRDSNGNPILLVPNIDTTRTMPGRSLNRVEYDQRASHLHHAPDYGIQLPPDFDMVKYKDLSKADKIAYAKQRVSPEIIISYQNAIGISMNPIFGTKTYGLRGFAGENRANVGLVIQQIPKTNKFYLSIIKDNGKHSTSYSITEKKLNKIIADGFWVLQNQKFN